MRYEVKGQTVVFGGHESWLKQIRGMTAGNIRFVPLDQVFDPSIIRNAVTVWIQGNRLSHKQYYRIMNIARANGIPVRYFTCSSAARCLEQIRAADRGGNRHV